MKLCETCPDRGRCKKLCQPAKKYANQDQRYFYKKVDVHKPKYDEAGSEIEPSNEPIDNLTVHACDPDDIVPLVSGWGFTSWEIRYLYCADLKSNYQKAFTQKKRTPAWAFIHMAALHILYRFFLLRQGVREISRRVEVSSGYVSKVISRHQPVLYNHLLKVFPDDL